MHGLIHQRNNHSKHVRIIVQARVDTSIHIWIISLEWGTIQLYRKIYVSYLRTHLYQCSASTIGRYTREISGLRGTCIKIM